MIHRPVARRAYACLVTLLLSATAHAQVFRAYLASDGRDSNPCSVAAPCRLLPAALAVVANGGEIWMLDSANYNTGPVSITKSVTILAIPGALGSVVATGGNAIDIATAGVKVALRNLVIVPFPGGGGTNGINMTAGAGLTVENCLVAHLPGMGIAVITAASVRITDTTIRDSGGIGLLLQDGARATVTRTTISGNAGEGVRLFGSGPGLTTTADIADSTMEANLFGVFAWSNSASAVVRVSVRDSRAMRNTYSGMFVQSAGGVATLSASNNIISNNGGGITAESAGSKVWASGNTVSDNTFGLSNASGGTFESAGNNAVRNNGTDTAGIITLVAANAFTIGGTISGLSGSVVLQNNGGSNLSVSFNGSFTFPGTIANGSAYNVTALPPPGQTCTITNGAGTVNWGNVINVTVICGAVAPIQYEALPMTLDTVSAAVSIWTGSQVLDIPSSCGSPAIACPNGVPSNPAPKLALARTSTSVAQTANPAIFSFSSNDSLVSVTDIPMTISGVSCLVHIDTSAGASPTVQITGTAAFDSVVPPGAINRLQASNIVVTGLAAEDISVLGSGLCASSGSLFVNAAMNAVTDLLRGTIVQQRLCGAPGPPLFTACP